MVDAAGGRETREFDHVLAGTGYRVDIDRLRFLNPALRHALARVAGAPKLSWGFESSVPGLFSSAFPPPSFRPGPALRLRADYAARTVAAAIAARAPAAAPAPLATRGLAHPDPLR